MKTLAHLIIAVVVLMAAGCTKRDSTSNASSRPELATQLETAAASLDSSIDLSVPDTADVWLVAAPYVLEEQWSSLGLDLASAEKDRLIHENVAHENVLVARISKGAVEITTLGPQFAASPPAFVLHGGDSVTLQRRKESRPILIVRNSR